MTPRPTYMQLKLSEPTSVVLDQSVTKILAESAHGSFCVLPRHTDYVSTLVPGVLILTDEHGHELYFANDAGLLVKQGPNVFVSVRRAVQGKELGSLRRTVSERFQRLDQSERTCQAAVANLEASFLRKFLELQTEAAAR